jgi:hypothetical protein
MQKERAIIPPWIARNWHSHATGLWLQNDGCLHFVTFRLQCGKRSREVSGGRRGIVAVSVVKATGVISDGAPSVGKK